MMNSVERVFILFIQHHWKEDLFGIAKTGFQRMSKGGICIFARSGNIMIQQKWR